MWAGAASLARSGRSSTTARLVSLVGPGGVGKTRLAVRAGSDLARELHGWGVVGRARRESRDAGLVTDAVLAALDLRDQAGASRCEILTVVPAGATAAPAHRQLRAPARGGCTARERGPSRRAGRASRSPPAASRCRCAGEYVVPVPPLELPSATEGNRLLSCAERSRHAVPSSVLPRPRGIRAHRMRTAPPSPPCAGGSTVCRWRSSLQQSGPASSASSRSLTASATGSRCSPGEAAPRSRVIKR